MQPTPPNTGSFTNLGIAPGLLQVLAKMKFTTPTPIQHQAIPIAVEGKDVIGIAQTGTGKTMAFGIPMLQRLAAHGGRGLVILPTRELAYQVEEALRPFATALNIRTAVFVGGASMNLQRGMLRQNPRILIATPGRLNDHLEQRTVTLKEVNILVLDEADRMLDMGFKPQIDKILAHVPKKRQTMLFSATMPREILQLATSQMALPLRIEVAPAGTTAANIEQEIFVVRKEEKIRLLEKLLEEYKGSVLVFSRTKHGAKKMTRSVRAMGHAAAEIHANRSLAQRREALDGFKAGRYRVLIATDIAARGIDVTGISVVINFDLPDDPGDYVHRIGRTARAGREGRAISFATPDQTNDIRSIERLTRTPIRRTPLPNLPPARALPPGEEQDRDHTRSFRGGRPQYGNRGSGGGSRQGFGRQGGQGGGRRFR
ncbi:MAG: DEAD/DEAH box helicase [Candidatus Peribacteraceae bacterium]|nr:DEAD/DEAH box helicase [Candidatus Peribacteraceae bacterium]